LKDSISLAFSADPVRWLSLIGTAEWEFDKDIPSGTGGSVEKQDKARYELSMQHRWGDWWQLTATGSNEYTYENDWITQKEAKFKADLDLAFFDDLAVVPSYEITKSISYGLNEPLALSQEKVVDFKLQVAYTKEFGSYIAFAIGNDFGISQQETVDEVLNSEEVMEISEDTRIGLSLVEFLRNMQLDGEITRKATDVKDDEEPMLVDITYSLTWNWIINDFTLDSSFQYDDSGDAFDASRFNTRVAWTRGNVGVMGEYEIGKTYSDEIDEERNVNLNMNVQF
jgi:hypothetical protein